MAEKLQIEIEVVGETPISVDAVLAALRECYAPGWEREALSFIDLGMIYKLTIEGATVDVLMPVNATWDLGSDDGEGGGGIEFRHEKLAEVEGRVKDVQGVERCNVTLTAEPWTTERMTEDTCRKLGIG